MCLISYSMFWKIYLFYSKWSKLAKPTVQTLYWCVILLFACCCPCIFCFIHPSAFNSFRDSDLFSVLQFLYHAWITNPKAALKERGKEKRKFWKKYTKGVRHRKSKKESKPRSTRWKYTQHTLGCYNSLDILATTVRRFCRMCAGHVAVEVGELSDGQEKGEENKKSDGPGWFHFEKFVLRDLQKHNHYGFMSLNVLFCQTTNMCNHERDRTAYHRDSCCTFGLFLVCLWLRMGLGQKEGWRGVLTVSGFKFFDITKLHRARVLWKMYRLISCTEELPIFCS